MKTNTIKKSILLILLFVSNIFSQDSKRDLWQQPVKIMDMLGIKPGMVIGEAGAGDGYFTFFLAKRVGDKGRVYANDINVDALKKLWKRVIAEDIMNISIILGDETNPLFPRKKMDMVVMMLMFHEIQDPIRFLQNITYSLKKNSVVVIIDRDPEKYGQNYSHFKKKEQVTEIIYKANYEILKIDESLPRDYVFIIRPKR
ncbi:MAG: methyltransferase domain-containing protein [Ignavibacteriales bacterium]|nr:methyltransferase domain-containing protein [Ignavibacteriales bacterium]